MADVLMRGMQRARPGRLASAPRRGRGLRGSVIMMLIAVALAGCASHRGGPVPYNVSNFGVPDNPAAVATTEAYHLGPSDVLTVSVFNVPEFTGDYVVDNLGRIKLPLVGDVPVLGQTADDVAVALKGRLQAKYLRNPEVQVVVKTAQSQRVTVDGSVTAPGIYPVGPDTTLLQMIAQAKGTSDDANARRVVVFRKINGQRNAAAFDLVDVRRGLEPDPRIYGNDVVIVDGNRARKNFKDLLTTLPLLTLFRPF